MTNIKSYTFSAFRKFLRDNDIQYWLVFDHLVIREGQIISECNIGFEKNQVSIRRFPLDGTVLTFQAPNIFIMLSELVKNSMVRREDLAKCYIRGFSGVSAPKKEKSDTKIVKIYGGN